jgi:hypothetical protein
MMRLEIYVGSHCTNCQEALAIADDARRIVGLEVAVVDLDQESGATPDGIIAVPTYRLNGRIISMGNPERQRFLDDLQCMDREQSG